MELCVYNRIISSSFNFSQKLDFKRLCLGSYDDRWAKKAYNQKLRRRACADIMRTSVTLSTSGTDEPSVPPDTPAPALGSISEVPDDENRSSPTRPFQLTPKRKKAIEAVRFIAAHLKNEDDYAEVTAH